MWHELLGDAKFLAKLTAKDEAIAEKAQTDGCPWCRGRLDRADYPRKPRDDLGEAESSWARRISLCCAREGCRRRLTPPSTRFLGRKVYAAPYIVIALVAGAAARAIASARTRRRWVEWWQTVFIASACWVEGRAHLMPRIDERELPGSLLARFSGAASEALAAMLAWISPVTTSSARRRASAM